MAASMGPGMLRAYEAGGQTGPRYQPLTVAGLDSVQDALAFESVLEAARTSSQDDGL